MTPGTLEAPRPDEAPAADAITVARNVSTRCIAIAAEMLIGLIMLPFNVSHLGRSAYGLWVLAASITSYFSVLDLGYGGALVKFVAQYRAKRDARALNEILSTTFVLFTGFGLLAYGVAVVMAIFLGRLFHLPPDQAHVGRVALLVVSLNVAVGMAFGVFGSVINGFQRYDLNSSVSIGSSVIVAAVNVLVLSAGYGLVELIVATTAVRLATLWIYRANAYRVFPALRIHPRLFRRARLSELTSLSVYMYVIDWARKLNYSFDAVIIGAFMNTAAIALWTVSQRVAEAMLRFTIQLSDVLFPSVVDNDVSSRLHRLRAILLVGTRLSLATVMPIGVAVMLMADPIVQAWVGSSFGESVAVLQLLSLSVIFRVGSATATTLLKGAGRHRIVATTNIGTAIVNVLASVALVRFMGLAGVAIGTVVPIAAGAVFVLFPAGCRRVRLPLRTALAEAIWPAVWPAGVMALFIVLTRPFVGGSLVSVGAEMLAAVAVYAVTFLFFGVKRTERRLYLAKTLELAALSRPVARMSEGA